VGLAGADWSTGLAWLALVTGLVIYILVGFGEW
jgi:hypothetical protein